MLTVNGDETTAFSNVNLLLILQASAELDTC